eukprot:TRINITY_DN45340_c0_g1_i1.p1 TRINITY_DN45340_c0_g1~~TRINITY_DN45340_c0_g1_i1.p1  ORF type:complete len:364 (+),score=61.03 TRINITY_DN45340_c0_g1_i1:59-1093(+)
MAVDTPRGEQSTPRGGEGPPARSSAELKVAFELQMLQTRFESVSADLRCCRTKCRAAEEQLAKRQAELQEERNETRRAQAEAQTLRLRAETAEALVLELERQLQALHGDKQSSSSSAGVPLADRNVGDGDAAAGDSGSVASEAKASTITRAMSHGSFVPPPAPPAHHKPALPKPFNSTPREGTPREGTPRDGTPRGAGYATPTRSGTPRCGGRRPATPVSTSSMSRSRAQSSEELEVMQIEGKRRDVQAMLDRNARRVAQGRTAVTSGGKDSATASPGPSSRMPMPPPAWPPNAAAPPPVATIVTPPSSADSDEQHQSMQRPPPVPNLGGRQLSPSSCRRYRLF